MKALTLGNQWETLYKNTFVIFGVHINRLSFTDATQWLIEKTTSVNREKITCHFVNADCLNQAYTNQTYLNILNQSDRVFADGSGVKLACKIKKLPTPENINGTDLFPALCDAASEVTDKQLSIFLLGGKQGITSRMIKRVSKQYPHIHFVGEHHGYFNSNETSKIINRINSSGANLLLVGLGAPLQETWIKQHREQLKPNVCMGVGGLFDYYSGSIPRAPHWLRQAGFEWVWRLMQEPTRLAKRYLIGNFLFTARVIREKYSECQKSQLSDVDLNPLFTDALVDGKSQKIKKHAHSIKKYLAKGAHALSKLRKMFQKTMKRSIDIIGASCALILLSPLLLTTIVLIYMESPANVFFSQMRIGKNGKPFKLWKFRSMHTDAEKRLASLAKENEMSGGVLFKMKEDPRITRVGKFIRKYSIDELPQLWNVLNGSMSLVGPRPALSNEVSQYDLKDRQRLQVTPGITCIWQVSGRSDIPFEQQVELDHLYISKRSLLTDIKLLLATIPAVLTARGAY
ncbi:MAG: WecB/TagA/CpsF family glycosyltransferase [Arenicella sp.]